MTDWKNRIVETAEMVVKDLKANPKNWRKHPKAQADALAGVLDAVGWVQQVIWNRQTGHLVDGHLRVELAAKRKEKTIPVNVVDLSPEEEAMILATFDPIAAMAEADRQMLAGLMQSIETEDEQIQALLESIARDEKIDLGGEPAEAPEPQVDRAAELQEQWQTAPGQLWQCGEHRVLCGDSTSAEDVARLMGGERAGMVYADPPYGMRLDPRYDSMHNGKGHRKTGDRFAPVIGDDADFDPREAMRRVDGVPEQFWWGADYYRQHLPAGGSWIVWDKRSNAAGMDLDAVHGSSFELCWSKQSHRREIARVLWSGHHGMQGADKGERVHPTQKPVALAAWFFERFNGESVLDPFLGSGTTLIACEQLGRRCFGLEISPAYVAVILQRWHDMTGRDPVLLET